MHNKEILPPGKDPGDPPVGIDAIAGHLERIKTNLVWIDQYRLNVEQLRSVNPAKAESELSYLKHATDEAIKHLKRLTELLLAGYTVDNTKRIPKNLEFPG